MTDIASGRVHFLQDNIVKAIKRAITIDTICSGTMKEIFGKLLEDETIKSKVDE